MRFDVTGSERAAFARVFDLCVIGSGPAGITLARSMAAKGHDVALMEAGGMEWSPESQDVYAGEITGHDYVPLDEARLRFFGGTSYHWAGTCRAFDAADFRPRPGNPLGGWPIEKRDLDPYGPAAAAILDLGPGIDFADLPQPAHSRFRKVPYGSSPPTRFGEKYLDEITTSQRIFLGLNANLVDLRLEDDLSRVTEAVFRSYASGDGGFVVRARMFCLCTGGIENARLLLNFDSQIPVGIGNEADLVGRFFNDHPAVTLGGIIYEDLTVEREERTRYVPTEAFMAEHGTLPLVLTTIPETRARRSLVAEAARTAQCALPFGERLAEAVAGKAMRCDVGGFEDWWHRRDPERYPYARVFTNSEQALNPDSRVTLGDGRDAFGLRRPRLHWALQEIDLRTIQTATMAFAQELAAQDVGRMRILDWLLAEEVVLPSLADNVGSICSWHHMCTTRMSDDPATGVVDRNCRIHGVRNLYVGGSSVFASGSYVNPTYTIVQLALRLADHLDQELHV